MSEHEVLAHVDEYLRIGIEYDCSDIHLPTAYPPAWRRFGQLQPIWEGAAELTSEDTEQLTRSFLAEKEWNRLQERGDVDFAYQNAQGRFRASVVKQRLGYDICFRIIDTKVAPCKSSGYRSNPCCH